MTAQVSVGALIQPVSLFEPDALLPIQYLDTIRRIVPIEPEKRLMWAVLEDAVEAYQSSFLDRRMKSAESFNEEEKWILENNHRWLFSFNNICDILGFNADYLRAGLLAWKQKQIVVMAGKHLDPHRKQPRTEPRAIRSAARRS
jgi:hypothetical protein